MAEKYFNPFQGIDIFVPEEFHEDMTTYCQSSGSVSTDQSPFSRMVDLWFLSFCVAARLDLEPVDVSRGKTKKIIDGSIFSSDPWRIHILMLVAIAKSDDVEIVSHPREMMAVASGLAIAGLPRVIDMLKAGEPIWNLSEKIAELMSEKGGKLHRMKELGRGAEREPLTSRT